VRLVQYAQRLDDLDQRLQLALRATFMLKQQRLESSATRLWRENPRHRVAALAAHAAALGQRLRTTFAETLALYQSRLTIAARTLDAMSPLATLGRGFAVVRRTSDDALLRDASQAPRGTEIEATLAKGKIRATVTSSENDD
jgi:exodeoxyribonuclease VII large subunit